MSNISIDYTAMHGRVFVDIGHPREGRWRRVSMAQAEAWNKIPIKCSLCKRYAASLDHFYPYHTERNLCQFHLNKERKK